MPNRDRHAHCRDASRRWPATRLVAATRFRLRRARTQHNNTPRDSGRSRAARRRCVACRRRRGGSYPIGDIARSRRAGWRRPVIWRQGSRCGRRPTVRANLRPRLRQRRARNRRQTRRDDAAPFAQLPKVADSSSLVSRRAFDAAAGPSVGRSSEPETGRRGGPPVPARRRHRYAPPPARAPAERRQACGKSPKLPPLWRHRR